MPLLLRYKGGLPCTHVVTSRICAHCECGRAFTFLWFWAFSLLVQEEESALSKYSKKILMSAKPVPVLESNFKCESSPSLYKINWPAMIKLACVFKSTSPCLRRCVALSAIEAALCVKFTGYTTSSIPYEGKVWHRKIWRMATDSPNYYLPNFSSCWRKFPKLRYMQFMYACSKNLW